jgi:hypothetical protein
MVHQSLLDMTFICWSICLVSDDLLSILFFLVTIICCFSNQYVWDLARKSIQNVHQLLTIVTNCLPASNLASVADHNSLVTCIAVTLHHLHLLVCRL